MNSGGAALLFLLGLNEATLRILLKAQEAGRGEVNRRVPLAASEQSVFVSRN